MAGFSLNSGRVPTILNVSTWTNHPQRLYLDFLSINQFSWFVKSFDPFVSRFLSTYLWIIVWDFLLQFVCVLVWGMGKSTWPFFVKKNIYSIPGASKGCAKWFRYRVSINHSLGFKDGTPTGRCSFKPFQPKTKQVPPSSQTESLGFPSYPLPPWTPRDP